MKAYVFPVAPNPTKLCLYLAEKQAAGVNLGVEQVMVSLVEGEQNTPEFLVRNPFGALPILELDDGRLLTESLAIICYLEELHPDPAMIGTDPFSRAQIRELERVVELRVLAPVARLVHSTRSPLGRPPNEAVAEQSRQALPEPLAQLDAKLADGRPFLAGDKPTIADCTLAAAFQFGRFGGVEFDPGLTNLARWDAAYRARDVAQSVLVG
jgi:glutathione S-transferase